VEVDRTPAGPESNANEAFFLSVRLYSSLSLHAEPDIWKGGSRTVVGRATLLPYSSVNQTNAPQVTFSSAQEHRLNLYT